jgi:SAM-dependent methyltransferase
MYEYDATFFRYLAESSVRSAEGSVPHIRRLLSFGSVLDVGCGAGEWLSVYARNGVSDYVGVDGEYVRPEQLLIPRDRFMPRNVAESFDLGRSFDLVQCLEVGEHIPCGNSDVLVDNLVRHGKIVLFSAAVPGQGGENHINEQPFRFWRNLFATRGCEAFDAFRPCVTDSEQVEPWYRFNAVFYVHESAIGTLPAAVCETRVPKDTVIPTVSPLSFRARCAVLRLLPVPIVTKLAIAKHKIVLRRYSQAAGAGS